MHVLSLENQEFEGLNNAYLFVDGGSATLVDTGIDKPDIRAQLEQGLADHGLGFDDVKQILLTHWHPDHTGLAGYIQARSNATVHIHEADAPLVKQDDDATDAFQERHQDCFEEWGMPPAKREALRPHIAVGDVLGHPPTVETFTDGDRLDIGEIEFEVMAAPGHTAGLSCFVFEGETGPEALVGDAILPEYTPNVGGADIRVDRPLSKYVDTLKSIADRKFVRVWPGHRGVIETPTARARTILAHHRDRAREILDILSEDGPADTWTVSARLFGDLEGIHILHGPGEAHAHLDHMARHDIVEKTPEGYRKNGDLASVEKII